jgi:predicted DNA-binding transcriptional regulator YafY
VAHERWHSQQKAWLESDGSYVLELPYGVDQELVMDILKFGPNCTVEAPRELRERVAELASATASLYGRQA